MNTKKTITKLTPLSLLLNISHANVITGDSSDWNPCTNTKANYRAINFGYDGTFSYQGVDFQSASTEVYNAIANYPPTLLREDLGQYAVTVTLDCSDEATGVFSGVKNTLAADLRSNSSSGIDALVYTESYSTKDYYGHTGGPPLRVIISGLSTTDSNTVTLFHGETREPYPYKGDIIVSSDEGEQLQSYSLEFNSSLNGGVYTQFEISGSETITIALPWYTAPGSHRTTRGPSISGLYVSKGDCTTGGLLEVPEVPEIPEIPEIPGFGDFGDFGDFFGSLSSTLATTDATNLSGDTLDMTFDPLNTNNSQVENTGRESRIITVQSDLECLEKLVIKTDKLNADYAAIGLDLSAINDLITSSTSIEQVSDSNEDTSSEVILNCGNVQVDTLVLIPTNDQDVPENAIKIDEENSSILLRTYNNTPYTFRYLLTKETINTNLIFSKILPKANHQYIVATAKKTENNRLQLTWANTGNSPEGLWNLAVAAIGGNLTNSEATRVVDLIMIFEIPTS